MNNDEALLASLGYKPIRPNRLAAVSVERIKKLLIRALRITPQSAWAHYNLAVVLDHSREVARARLDALTRR